MQAARRLHVPLTSDVRITLESLGQFLPACLAHAGDLALVGQLAEADTADAVVAQVGVGSAADLAAVITAGGLLCFLLLLENHSFSCHSIFLLLKRRTERQ